MGDDEDGGGTSYRINEATLLASDCSSQHGDVNANPFVSLHPDASAMDTNSKSVSTSPRLKAYPPDFGGPYVVFFRPKGKRLNTVQISKDLTKRFSSVIAIDMVGTGKLRVSVGDRKQANEIVAYELFTLEYFVYIPSHQVEISGKVAEGSLTCETIMQGCGRFKNPSLPPVQILDCRQLHSVCQEGEKKVYTPSDEFCVTFSGSALPDLLVIGKLRLPVRLYVPKVMNCTNCKQLGHTAQYCGNKPRCATCGERHVDGACKTPPKCVYCGSDRPHDLNVCPKYIQQKQHQKRSLQQRSRRSYAEMLKKAAPVVESRNIYLSLSLDDQGSDSEVGDGVPFVFKGETRKRMRLQRPTKKPRNLPSSDPQPTVTNSRSVKKGTKRSPPGFKIQDERDFPSLPGTSKIPDVPIFSTSQPEGQHSENQEQPLGAPMFTLSGIVDIILNFFNAPDSVKNIIKGLLPCVSPLLKQLASKMPLLATIVSFDG
ncbi:uncharacterized protein LOC134287222 [Aedes albopictus]|uniref:Uncharacterized protein n=1 Tax=Aedes albopictus TaxID=7160 RepID=A0ABM1Y8G1_AEDAL